MRVSWVMVLIGATALSGCIGSDDTPSDAPAAPTGAATPSGSTGGQATASVPTGGGTATTAPTDPGPPPEPTITTLQGNFLVKTRPPTGPPHSAGNVNDQFEVSFNGGATGHILILEWSASSPATAEMALWARKAPSDGFEFYAAGPSPLFLGMGANESSSGTYLVDVVPTGTEPNVGVNQAFVCTIATFDGIPYDPAWRPSS